MPNAYTKFNEPLIYQHPHAESWWADQLQRVLVVDGVIYKSWKHVPPRFVRNLKSWYFCPRGLVPMKQSDLDLLEEHRGPVDVPVVGHIVELECITIVEATGVEIWSDGNGRLDNIQRIIQKYFQALEPNGSWGCTAINYDDEDEEFSADAVFVTAAEIKTFSTYRWCQELEEAHKAKFENRPADYATPGEGGCWWCYRKHGDMLFSSEFDTHIHPECLVQQSLEVGIVDDPERDIILNEFAEYLKSPEAEAIRCTIKQRNSDSSDSTPPADPSAS